MVCVDETGPESAKSFAGAHLVDVTTRPAKRGKQEIDYGRRGKGYGFGAFQPESGKALTCTAARRTTANFVAFLERVETWIDPLVERVYGNYEVVALDRLADRYDMDVSRVKRRLVNLTRYVHGKVYFPVRSNSLKEIGRFLGVTWNTATPSGLQSLVWRHLWDVNRTDTFREQLIAYNAADCRALYVLANGLSQIEHTPKAGTRLRVADQPELSLAAPNQPLLEEFKGMLQVAYFDYDHKKLAFRQRVAPTSGKRKRGGMKGHVGHRFKANARLSRANRVVHVAPRATCPNHKGEPLTVSYATAETSLIDLADTKSGWRKVIIRYVGHQAYCRKCEYRYVPPPKLPSMFLVCLVSAFRHGWCTCGWSYGYPTGRSWTLSRSSSVSRSVRGPLSPSCTIAQQTMPKLNALSSRTCVPVQRFTSMRHGSMCRALSTMPGSSPIRHL